MTYVIIDFSNHYFGYFNAYAHQRPVPDAWKIAYDQAMHGDANGGQDVLLASNAHTQHDLPYIYAEMGMRTRGGTSRKHDHDAVNEVNTRVFDGLEDYYAQHYDPFFSMIDMKPSPLDEIGTMETVKTWHGPHFIGHPCASAGVLTGNPLHEDAVQAARLAGTDFIVDVALIYDAKAGVLFSHQSGLPLQPAGRVPGMRCQSITYH